MPPPSSAWGKGSDCVLGCASVGIGGLGRGRWTQEAQAEGTHPAPLIPSSLLLHFPSGNADLRQPWGGARKRTHNKTTAPGGQTFLLNFPVKQRQYSCPLELGESSDSADEGLCMQQLSFYTHAHMCTHTAECKTSGSSHSSGCLDALSPCHSLGSQPGGRSLEQAWGLETETLLSTSSINPA